MMLKYLFKLYLSLLLFLPLILNAQTSLEEIISDMTLNHEGQPHGVPTGYDWALKPRKGVEQPPAGWTAAIAWGQVYEWIEGNPAKNTRVQIKDMEMYYLSKADHKWHLLQKPVTVDGSAYVEDFAGDVNKPADKRIEEDGSVSVTCGNGYNFHFWPKPGRVKYPENDMVGCYVTVKARLILDNLTGTDDRSTARYLLSVGGDWWQTLTVAWDNYKTNADMGIGRFRFVTNEWKSFNMISVPIDSVRNNPPPFASVATSENQLPYSKPEILKLEQNYPNPFLSSTQINFSLAETNPVNLSVFDVNGSIVEILLNKSLNSGSYSIEWDGSYFPSGTYFIKLKNNNFGVTKACQLTR